MGRSIYWFRSDLRLLDNPQFLQACRDSASLLPVFLVPPAPPTQWGFARVGDLRRQWLRQSLADLRQSLRQHGSDLLVIEGGPRQLLPELYRRIDAEVVYCEEIAAPEEQNELANLQAAGVAIRTHWQSSMLDPEVLGFPMPELPDVFTAFRQSVERRQLKFAQPVPRPDRIPPLPAVQLPEQGALDADAALWVQGGESLALNHLRQYLAKRLPDRYKATRNELSRFDASSKFSPWLATGALSARTIAQALDDYERQYGANDGTYWLWFELLWRDYFRLLMRKYGKRLFGARGLGRKNPNPFDRDAFAAWSAGTTGVDLIDAGMTELRATGFLSNRMRQIVASHWIHAMHGDWRVGAAWFESCLIDYDVYSNQGNWLYLAGHGTDPRGGRAFNVAKQIEQYDADGSYRQRWLNRVI